MDEFELLALKASQDKSNLTLDGETGAARSINQAFVDGALWARKRRLREMERLKLRFELARREMESLAAKLVRWDECKWMVSEELENAVEQARRALDG